jgi:hypothetical protein
MFLAIQNFENALYSFYNESENNKKILRAVACRFYRIRIRSLIEVIINNIILTIFDIDISWFSSTEYNSILFNRHTPIKVSYVLNQIIFNYINTNESVQDNRINTHKHYEIKLEPLCVLDSKNNNIPIECSICYESAGKTQFVSLDCKHEYCIDCTEQFMNKNISSCPFCRNKIEKLTCYTEEEYNKLNDNKNNKNNIFMV